MRATLSDPAPRVARCKRCPRPWRVRAFVPFTRSVAYALHEIGAPTERRSPMTFKQIGLVLALAMGAPGLAAAQQQQPQPQPQPQPQQQPQQQQQAQQQPSDAGQKLIQELHTSNQMEILTGTLAEERAQSKEVKQFARTLSKEHQKNDKQLTQMAKKQGVTLKPEMSDEQKESFEQLFQAQGPEFDRQFLQVQQQAHERTIQQLQQAQDEVQDPKLQAMIKQTLPALQKHHKEANRLMMKIEQQGQKKG